MSRDLLQEIDKTPEDRWQVAYEHKVVIFHLQQRCEPIGRVLVPKKFYNLNLQFSV
jgi:hypothetical protein